ncbi:MAG TPA: NPCBM/NEW2 domain-containing protein [Pirellulales bacterium]|nr:NPCBM/NEW2 domain-containing protein [Pirellulales bacterium]
MEIAEGFDPYRRWLGIPVGERPPNHYSLLGLNVFEDDADAIANAADRQMAYVRTHQNGPYVAATQKVLNELAAARLCLLNPTQKARYDADLKAKHAPAPRAPIPVPVSSPAPQNEQIATANVFGAATPIAISAPTLRSAARHRSKDKLPDWLLPAAGGLVVGALLTWLMTLVVGNEGSQRTEADTASVSVASPRPTREKAVEDLTTRRTAENPTNKAADGGEKVGTTEASIPAGAAPIFESIEPPSQLGVEAEKLVLWNTHSGTFNDRGVLECNVRLMSDGREVWNQMGIPVPWIADGDRNIAIALPAVRFDAVRVEITKWENLGGGLTEVEVLSADGRNLARGCPASASGLHSRRFDAEHVVDGITTSAEVFSGYWLLPDKTAGWVEIDLSLPRPMNLAGVKADKLVVWNQHNGPHNNSATQRFDVTLYAGPRATWHKEQIELSWAPGDDTSAAVELPTAPFDRVRIDVTPPAEKWGGLAEVQLFHGGENLALDCPAVANGIFDERRRAGRVTDGIVRSDVENVGYWLLPEQFPGWVEIDLACLDAHYGAACRQLGLTRLLDGDWRRGLPWLARGDHAALRRLAQADQQDWYDTSEQVALGDAWWEWAQRSAGEIRKHLLARSLWRYRKALSKLQELAKTEIQARFDAALPELPERHALFFMSESELQAGDAFFREMPVVVRGEPSPYGLFLHAISNGSSHVAFHLGKRYRRFRGAAAINDTAWNRTVTPLTFRIVGNGRELWKSSPMQETGSSEPFELEVAGIEKLELYVDCPGDHGWGHAAWVEPWVE